MDHDGAHEEFDTLNDHPKRHMTLTLGAVTLDPVFSASRVLTLDFNVLKWEPKASPAVVPPLQSNQKSRLGTSLYASNHRFAKKAHTRFHFKTLSQDWSWHLRFKSLKSTLHLKYCWIKLYILQPAFTKWSYSSNPSPEDSSPIQSLWSGRNRNSQRNVKGSGFRVIGSNTHFRVNCMAYQCDLGFLFSKMSLYTDPEPSLRRLRSSS